MQRLNCKYSEEVLIPANGIRKAESYVTSDGIPVRVEFIATWNNTGGIFDNELDEVCRRKWDIPFRVIKSIWISRLGIPDDYWHLIKLYKNG